MAPVKLWCDTATARECGEIAARFGNQRRCIEEVGNAILPGYTASKIAWLKNHHPELYAELATILLPHDYLNHYLTGELVMERGDASGTGMLDIRTLAWTPPSSYSASWARPTTVSTIATSRRRVPGLGNRSGISRR